MILIGIAWLLIVAIAFYQSLHGLFSAVIMAFLTTVCAVFALGYYEWLGPLFLYDLQPAYADALSVMIHFIIPLLILRIIVDKLIGGNAPLGAWPDRIAGGFIGLYIGTLMVGVLMIVFQMLPWGSSFLGYTPFDNSLQRSDRLYCDEFALGVFKCAGGLATDRSFEEAHDDFLLELFCARNTSGLNGRVDAERTALRISAAFKPGATWKKVAESDKLPANPGGEAEKTDILIVSTEVSNSVRSDRKEDGWYRLPATHYRLVTGSGRSLYPLGYISEVEGKWTLFPAKSVDGKPDVASLHVVHLHKEETEFRVLWVYRLPKPEDDEADFTSDEDPEKAKELKLARDELYAPNYMVFRRTAKMIVPPSTPALLPLTEAEKAAKAARLKAAQAAADARKAAATPKSGT